MKRLLIYSLLVSSLSLSAHAGDYSSDTVVHNGATLLKHSDNFELRCTSKDGIDLFVRLESFGELPGPARLAVVFGDVASEKLSKEVGESVVGVEMKVNSSTRIEVPESGKLSIGNKQYKVSNAYKINTAVDKNNSLESQSVSVYFTSERKNAKVRFLVESKYKGMQEALTVTGLCHENIAD